MIISSSPKSLSELLALCKVTNWEDNLSPLTSWIQKNITTRFTSHKKQDIEDVFSRFLELNQYDNLTSIADPSQEYSVLHQAAKFGFDSFLEKSSKHLKPELLNEHLTPHKNTALHLAALYGHPNTIEFLLDEGADPNRPNNFGKYPIHFSAVFPEEDKRRIRKKKDCIRLLLQDTKAEVILQPVPGKPQETFLGVPLIFSLLSFDDKDLLHEALEKCPAAINCLDKQGQNILHYAIIHNLSNVIDYLLNNEQIESLLNQKTANFSTPLVLACRYGNSKVLAKLLQHPSCLESINAQDEHERSALHWAYDQNDNESINLLIHNHAKTDSLDVNRKTPSALKTH